MWYNYTRASNLNTGNSCVGQHRCPVPRCAHPAPHLCESQSSGPPLSLHFPKVLPTWTSHSTTHRGALHCAAGSRCVWKPRGSCPDLNGPLLILQMDEDIEVHGVCSSFTSAPSGFTALPRSVITAGKVLLVGFLHPYLSEARKGGVREAGWYTMCLRIGAGPWPRKGTCMPRSDDQFLLTKADAKPACFSMNWL